MTATLPLKGGDGRGDRSFRLWISAPIAIKIIRVIPRIAVAMAKAGRTLATDNRMPVEVRRAFISIGPTDAGVTRGITESRGSPTSSLVVTNLYPRDWSSS